MDRISDGDLSWLRGHVEALRISAYKESVDTWDDVLRVIDELWERRAAEKDYRKALDAARIEIMRGYSNEKQD